MGPRSWYINKKEENMKTLISRLKSPIGVSIKIANREYSPSLFIVVLIAIGVILGFATSYFAILIGG